jgi:methylamine dehydrogenase light chain
MPNHSVDGFGEKVVRSLASRTSRRGILSRLGLALAAAPIFPLLPVGRGAHAAEPNKVQSDFTKHAQPKDDKQCCYWRYCAIDGALCSCCGGDAHTCPPGSTPSATAWIGTCINPDDNRTYLIAYHDCCGANMCGQCDCVAAEGESPIYRPSTDNDIVWCFGLPSMTYHCSVAAVVGVAS